MKDARARAAAAVPPTALPGVGRGGGQRTVMPRVLSDSPARGGPQGQGGG